MADLGYQGLASRHPQTCLTIQKPEGKALDLESKKHNRAWDRFRVATEHVIRKLKVWRILKETYRDRRKRFALSFNPIAGLLNAGLEL